MEKTKFILNDDSYYSMEANKLYCSSSQFKSFYGVNGCEARAMAEINGEYVRPTSTALLVGSYLDCILIEPNKVEKFKEEHPEMFSSRGATKGMLKSEFAHVNTMVDRVKKDTMFMKALDGEKQVIMTGKLFGLDFKIKMDVYHPHKAIVDLKSVESMRKAYFHPTMGRCSFVDYFGYVLSASIYQEIVYQNTGERLPFYLACVSKEAIPDIELIGIDNQTLHDYIYGNSLAEGIASQVEQIRLLKSGEIEPTECGRCDYCLPRKVIQKPISYLDLLGEG